MASPSRTQGQIGSGYATVSNASPAPAPTSQRRAPHRLIRKPALATITAPATASSDLGVPLLPVLPSTESTVSSNQSPEQGTSASVSVPGRTLQTNSSVLSPTASGAPVTATQSVSSPKAITSSTASLGSSRVTAASSGSTSATSSGSRSLQRLIAEMPGMSQMVSTPSDPPASPAPSLTLSTSSLSFTATQGTANPPNQSLTVTSNGSWTASDDVSWLSLSTTSGSNNGTITVSMNTANMAIGTHAGTITVIGGGITRTANVMLSLNASATSSVTLTWNANTESDLAGYKVYRATSSGSYGAPIATLPGNITSYVAAGLQSGTTYFFVITAYDNVGNESLYSNEVSRSIF